MGFLDRLVSDLIKDSTGLPVRGVVRAIGTKNLLLMGGAALAGGFAAHAAQSAQARPSAPAPPIPAAVPPPIPTSALPPIPTTVSPPPPPSVALPPLPPPPAPTAAPADVPDADEPPPEVTYPIVRTMVAAALADGELGAEEREMILGRLGESGFSPQQVQQIHRDLVLPPSPRELAAMVPPGEAHETLYRFAALVVLADRNLGEHERAWLDRLGATFEIPAERRRVLEGEVVGG